MNDLNLPADRPCVVVLGARGRFGLAAVRAFAAAGWPVLAVVRPGASGPAIAGVQWLAHDLQDTAALLAAARGSAVVVHALNPPYVHRQWLQQAPRLMAQAIALARGLGATLMLPGNVYNFGAAMPERLREDTPQLAQTVKGRVRIALEQQLQAATADGHMRAVVIRAGDFFGSGRGSWFDLLLAPGLRRGKLALAGPLDSPGAWAYLPDLARTFVLVAEHRRQLPDFDCLHFGGHTLSGADWREALTDLAWERGWLPAGGTLKPSPMPWGMLRAGSLFVPTWAALCEMRYLWTTPHQLVNDRLQALIGREPHTPLPEAVRTALADLEPALPAAEASGLARA